MQKRSNLIISMPLFNSDEEFSPDKIFADLKSHWGLDVSDISGDGSIATFKVGGETAAIAFMSAPIPPEEFESIVGFNYLWKNAQEELTALKSHAIVSVMANDTADVERFKILTMINASVLRTSANSIGIYQGTQTLLLPKALYLGMADSMLEDILPIPLWIYIGVVNGERNSVYTYGMKEFGKDEIEIIDSTMAMGELHGFLVDALHYILASDVTLNNGETIGLSEEQKIKITKSKAVYLDGESLKFEM